MRFGVVLCGVVALGLGGCILSEVRNEPARVTSGDPVRMTGGDAYAYCRGLAARSGTPVDDACRRALNGDLPNSTPADVARPRYAAGGGGPALADATRDRRDAVIRCVERRVDGALVTTCR